MNVVTGDFSHTHTDVSIPTTTLPLEFTRFYHAGSDAVGTLGRGWTHSYDYRLEFDGSDVNVFYPDGHATWFTYSAGDYTPAWVGVRDQLVHNGDGTYTLTANNQIQYNFSSSGLLIEIVDRNGNTTTFTYSSGLLSSVEEPGGRQLTFTYTAGLVDEITAPLDGSGDRIVGFDYTGDLLTSVTDVKGGTTEYEYDNDLLTQLTDSNSHVAVQNIYDDDGRVAEQIDALGGITCIYYSTFPLTVRRIAQNTPPRSKACASPWFEISAATRPCMATTTRSESRVLRRQSARPWTIPRKGHPDAEQLQRETGTTMTTMTS